VLKIIVFGCKRYKLIGEWRKLYGEFYYTPHMMSAVDMLSLQPFWSAIKQVKWRML